MKATKRYHLTGVGPTGAPLNITTDPNDNSDVFASQASAVSFATTNPHLFPGGRFQVVQIFVLEESTEQAAAEPTGEE